MVARSTCWCTTQGPCRRVPATDEGFEATYASQVLSQHILTSRLLPALQRGSRPRVIVVSSGGMYAERLDPATVQMTASGYDGVRAYARAKRAQVTLTEQWARRFPEASVGLPLHASGLGRHPRGAGVPADLPPGHPSDPAHRAGGRGHDRVARRSRADPGAERFLLAGPGAAAALCATRERRP